MRFLRFLDVVIAAAAVVFSGQAAIAQTWVGASGTALWDITSNWSGVAPVSGGTSALVFSGTTLLTSTNNIANLTANSISFTNTTVGSGGFVLSGSTVALRGNITMPALLSGNVTDEIAFDLVLTDGTRDVTLPNGGSRNLIISGSIGQDGTARTLSRSGNGGTLFLTNTANSFSQLSSTASGGFSVSQLGMAGLPSQTGTGASITLNGSFVIYTGTGETSDKRIQVGSAIASTNGATLTNNGTGQLTLLGNGGFFTTPFPASTSASRTFTLQGSNTGDNKIAATIADVNSGTTTLALTKAQAGKWILSGSNTYTGATTVSAGTLQIGDGATGSLHPSSTITGASGATLAFGRSDTIIQGTDFNSVIGGSLNVAQMGAGTLVLNGANTYSGTTRVVAGTLQVGGGSTTGSLNTASVITGSAGGTLAFNRSDTVTQGTHFNNVISGALGVAQISSGTLVFSGTNTYSGGTWIAAGTLQLGSDTALPSSSAMTLGTGSTAGTLFFNGNTATLGSLAFNGTGSQVGAGGRLNLLASGTANATITVTSGSHALHPDTTLQSNTVLDTAAGSFFSLNGVIDGAKSLTKLGSGTAAIYGANSYSGGTFLGGGLLAVNGQLAGPVAVESGATLGGSGAIAGMLSGAGLVSPGNSPGILTATQFDPSGGLDAAFELTGLSPVYSAPSASVNDILRLTSGTPFTESLGVSNVIDVYFNMDSVGSGPYEAGFFTSLSAADLFTELQNATVNYWIKDSSGGQFFNGVNYSPFSGVTLNTATVTRDFGSGGVTGSVTQFIIVPEPESIVLACGGLVVAAWMARRRRS
jgi:fibronectin-binding autotransporter adhesin